ncbi:hypothetical protein DFH07DRAFT_777713 [Mycena maculata]|uniref:Uncharacterized protein n=1 Tax=Mycena maculata TaxID=230809 RepID=A0AAD7IGB8_9AGAR|nr:hypothetical protein DFH07DRAFT_777713 [Mycena maculata]
MYSPPSSPSSPTSMHSRQMHKTTIPSGFRPAPKPKRTPISEMSVRELQDLHNTNIRLLASPYVPSFARGEPRLTSIRASRESTSADAQSWMARVTGEQDAIQGRLVELLGIDAINTGLKNTAIKAEDDMNVDPPPEPYISPALEAKRKALSRFGPANGGTVIGSLSMQEAIQLEQQAHLADKERQERALEKRKRMGLSIPGEQLTRQEREARIWAFMNHKPTDSDLEDDSEEEYDEDDDPASWFNDEDEDGRKGQLIVEPDEEDYSAVIRIDSSKAHYSTFYEPRTEGD